MAPIRCADCGREHGSGSEVVKLGWRAEPTGAALLARCTCGSVVVLGWEEGASLCEACHRLIPHDEERLGERCVSCARKEAVPESSEVHRAFLALGRALERRKLSKVQR